MTEKYQARRFALTAFLYCIGSAYILGGTSGAGRDEWLARLLSALAGLPIVMLCAFLSGRHPGLDLFSILRKKLPKGMVSVLSALGAVYAAVILGMSLSCFSRYTAALILTQTPKAVMSALLALCVLLFASKGAAPLCRVSGFLFALIVPVLAAVFVLSVPSMHGAFLLPVGRELRVLHVYRSLAFPFVEPVLLFALAPSAPKGVKPRHWLLPYLGGAAVLVFGCMRNTAVLGDALAGMFSFQAAAADSIVGYESVHQRLEVLTTMIPAAAGLVDAALSLRFASGALASAFGKRESRLAPPACMLAGFLVAVYAFRTDASLQIKNMLWPGISSFVHLLLLMLCLLPGKKKTSAKAKKFLCCLKKAMK